MFTGTMKNKTQETKGKMTIDKLARISQAEFKTIRTEMATKEDLREFATKDDLKRFATKDDLKMFATKVDLADLRDTVVEAVREENLKVLQNNDRVMTKLDRLLTEDAAHTGWHKRIDSRLDEHDGRIKKLERVKG